MSHPVIISSNADARYRQMLENAEAERRYRQIKSKNHGLLQGVADLLISAGHKLKAQGRPSSSIGGFAGSK